MKKIKVSSPGSLSNLCCGFDILGMALNAPADIMELEITDEPGISIRHTDHFGLPEDPDKNLAGISLKALAAAYPKPIGFKLIIEKTIMPGSGLGSSAASCAGAVVAANMLLDNYFSKEALIEFALAGEQVASGARHADNLAPCIYGGTTLVRSLSPLDIISLPSPGIYVTVVHPQIEIKTSYAREILPKDIPLKTAVKQWGNVGGLITGFFKNDHELISRSLVDHVAEPVRSALIPGFDEIKKKSMEAGALGGGISGSGPSLFMFSSNEQTAEKIKKIMEKIYIGLNIEHRCYVTTINNEGVKQVEG